ncbi:hypothetical protein E2C01_043089 [Portunus trituberculatus]|uniref:Uncharacterized protein n=1 Tax=Portunus trituberculatus TaxID=210409 RepID=A0A5B7FPB3_PORTR|nr:hypothetical protein [Portunus trituberculatus]
MHNCLSSFLVRCGARLDEYCAPQRYPDLRILNQEDEKEEEEEEEEKEGKAMKRETHEQVDCSLLELRKKK